MLKSAVKKRIVILESKESKESATSKAAKFRVLEGWKIDEGARSKQDEIGVVCATGEERRNLRLASLQRDWEIDEIWALDQRDGRSRHH